ncbi:hypothetical protein PL75_09085 [Neisseria arctica]|uniref:Probable septum site-determining protein MinC n=1 Tax=Neisseria arctica TaxID=1470200 RepID=A0A0J0YQ88_9NEIS|nr:septum site-determining protein MinC [Neisseria arctica]KLT72301.1 hypothetical protein PL75_09085 [Neisseria arctica]UOO86631.1 septum site-determining protein MinC [Neisseria arctica]
MTPAFDVKSARLDALAIRLYTSNITELETLLQQRADQYRNFKGMPFILDLYDFDEPSAFDTATICTLFAKHGLNIIGLRHHNTAWEDTASANGLAFVPAAASDGIPVSPPTTVEPVSISEPVKAQVISQPTVFVNTPIRTGQQVYAENADLIVTGMVSEGAEIIADGNIHVYGPMRGRALAGANGNRSAHIFIHSMQAELVSVAGIYRNFEQDLPPHLHKKPVQVSLKEDRLIIGAIDAE